MGFRFRKSIKMGPVRVNLSKSGVGYSVGGKGFRYTKKARGGTRTTASIPGTGISYSKDSSKKKTSFKSASRQKNTSSAAKSGAMAQEKKSGGCLSSCLWVFGACLVIGLIREYWPFLLAAALIGGVIFIAVRRSQEKKKAAAANEQALQEKARIEENDRIRALKEQERQDAILRFDEELQSIPKAEISLGDPAPRHLLKDIPEYSFSNITRKTRVESIFPLVFLDVETTGLAPSKGEIVEVSAIRFEKGMRPVSCFTTLCRPKHPIPAEATAINNITDEMVEDAPTFARIAPALSAYLQGCNIAGHNLDFDLRFIFAHGADLPVGTKYYDTLDLAQLTISKDYIANYKLDTVCDYYSIQRTDAHRSLSDCYATSKIFPRLVSDKTELQLVDSPSAIDQLTV